MHFMNFHKVVKLQTENPSLIYFYVGAETDDSFITKHLETRGSQTCKLNVTISVQMH